MYDISKIIEIRCDRCGDKTSIWYPVSASVKIILKQVRRDGWSIGKKCLCPECSGKVKA